MNHWKDGVPIPYKEEDDPKHKWKVSKLENEYLLTSRGYLTDCMYSYRGHQVDPFYITWTALYMLSTIIKREAWMEWGHGRMYPNIYVILIGKSGISCKGTSIELCEKVLPHFHKHIKEESWAYIKRLLIIRNKTTPQGMIDMMVPENKARLLGIREYETIKDKAGRPVTDKNGNIRRYKVSSEATLVLPELAVMVSKQAYMDSLVDLLTDLYDTKDIWTSGTKGDGTSTLKNHYLTLIGAITPRGFRDSIPKQATDDGFLSRTITIYTEGSDRIIYKPYVPIGAPTHEELRRRLAWISEKVIGEYKFSDDADKYLESWYMNWQIKLKKDTQFIGINSRKYIHLRKVAFLIRASKYREGNMIELEDVIQAEKLLDMAYHSARNVIEEIQGGEYVEGVNAVEDFIKARGKVTRRKLCQGMKKYKSYQINEFLSHSVQIGNIRIELGDTKNKKKPGTSSNETYYWEYGG
jgi:hypothetical protein